MRSSLIQHSAILTSDCSSLRYSQTIRGRICRKALIHWDNKTISRHNARINFKILDAKKKESLARSYKTKWKTETMLRRAKRMSELLKVWKAFFGGIALSKRSSENIELAERFRYVAMAKLGVNSLFVNWKNKSYLKGEIGRGAKDVWSEATAKATYRLSI